MATLWAQGCVSELWYSLDNGSTWTKVTGLPGFNFSEIGGPTSVWKVYAGFDGKGVYYYDGTWHLEDNYPSFYANNQYRPHTAKIWCNDNDTLVVAAISGNAQIRTRPGGPGTPWTTEYDDTGTYNNTPRHVHGNGSGSAVYAIFQDSGGVSGTDGVLRRRNPSTGVWSEVARVAVGGLITSVDFRILYVVSDTEVYIGGNITEAGASYIRIWRWYGSSLLTSYTTPITIGINDGLYGLWLNSSGVEGWAVIEDSSSANRCKYYYYNGIAWLPSFSFNPYARAYDINQRDGISDSAISLHGTRGEYNWWILGSGWQTDPNFGYPSAWRQIWGPTPTDIATAIQWIEVDPVTVIMVDAVGATATADAIDIPGSGGVIITATDRPLITVIAHNILRVTFTADMADTPQLFNVENYTIDKIDPQSRDVRVLQVRGAQDAEGQAGTGSVRSVDLVITEPSLDMDYIFNVQNIETITGNLIINAYSSFIAHNTKGDSILNCFPGCYALNSEATLRHVLLAMAIADDKIGGKENLSALSRIFAGP